MLSSYKIKRELRRIINQPKQWPSDFLSYVGGARYYDWFLAKNSIVKPGEQDFGDNVAIYLIYPSNGLKPSHLRTLQYLTRKQYSVVVVCNLALRRDDEQQILPLCHRYIQRPNYGYDFGGYRDGVLSALSGSDRPKRLILLNDSTWFPITDHTDWLEDVVELDLDFAAAASNFGVPRPDPSDFKNMKFNYRVDHRRFHYCSFALAFGSRILNDPDFTKFWKKFPLTNKKKSTVRRGEVGLTAWVLKKGYSHGSTFDTASLEQSLRSLPDERLDDVIQHLIVPEDERMKHALNQALENLDSLSKDDRIKLVLTTVARQGVSYASAYFNIFEQGFPFLKKSPIRLDPKSRETTMTILQKLNSVAANEAREEALEMVS